CARTTTWKSSGAHVPRARPAGGERPRKRTSRPSEGCGCAMRTLIVAVGVRMPRWVTAGFDDYCARLPRDARIELLEVKPEKRAGGMPAGRALERESARIEAALPAGCLR